MMLIQAASPGRPAAEVRSDMASWHFKRREGSDEAADPIQGEFFDEAADPDERRRGPAASLVREAIQNSLDAQANADEPVHVRFFLSDDKGLPAERAGAWFAPLWPHLLAERSGIRAVDEKRHACRFVAVEDFGTRGLEGNPQREQTPDKGETDDFFAFFRANGLSGKAGQEGGRWGVGKSVFNRASRITSFLALTVRHSDRRPLLLGRSLIANRSIQRFFPHTMLRSWTRFPSMPTSSTTTQTPRGRPKRFTTLNCAGASNAP